MPTGDAPESPPITQQGELCVIESVYDSDTMWVSCCVKREQVRLYCIDAPELQQKPWGKNARDYLRTVLTDHVGVERISSEQDGRRVAQLFTMDGNDANLELIRAGHAVVD